MARPERIRLGDLLIQEQLHSAAQLAEALADQKSSGRKLGRIFVDRGWVTEAQIARALARQLGAPFVDLGTRSIAPEMTALLPEARARPQRALPREGKRGGGRANRSVGSDGLRRTGAAAQARVGSPWWRIAAAGGDRPQLSQRQRHRRSAQELTTG
jgi:MSHA biogenesis protein MshE